MDNFAEFRDREGYEVLINISDISYVYQDAKYTHCVAICTVGAQQIYVKDEYSEVKKKIMGNKNVK